MHQEDLSTVQTPDYHGGHDEDFAHSDLEANAALATTVEFISAWLTPDAHHRVQLLEPVAAVALTEGLADPYTRIWQATPDGPPTLHASSGQAVTTRQTMTDGRAVELLLHYEPDTTHGWIVTDIAPSQESTR